MQYSIVQSSEKEPISLRIDAEFYSPIFLRTEKLLKQAKWDYLENLTVSIKSFGAYSLCNQVEYFEKGIPFLRCKDIKGGLIDFSNVLFIDSDANKLLWKSEVKPKTVLFTMSGTVGNTAIASEDLGYPINSNQDIAKITTNEKLNPYYFSIFLQSAYGKQQISRLPIGSVQHHIFLWQIEKIIVPLFVDGFQSKIEGLFKLALYLQKISKSVFKEGESLLLDELGLINWQPKHQLTFIKNYSDTQQAERIDAEYYQPKYDEIISAIKSYSGGWDTLNNLVNLKDQNYNPISVNEYNYIELSNISGNGEITGCTTECGDDLPSRARRKVKERDVIVSSIEGSLSSIALVGKEYNNALCSTGFYVINSGFFNSEALLVLMKSVAGQMLLKKGCNGTILTAINKDDFLSIPLPKLRQEKQQEIQRKVNESFNLREQSKQLLESAKKAVEMAIEQDEQTAIDWLKVQTKSIGVIDANGL